jgi:hypothetical protein
VIVWLWDAPGPARTTRGVTGSQTRARQAAEALITGGQAHGAVLEQAVLGLVQRAKAVISRQTEVDRDMTATTGSRPPVNSCAPVSP